MAARSRDVAQAVDSFEALSDSPDALAAISAETVRMHARAKYARAKQARERAEVALARSCDITSLTLRAARARELQNAQRDECATAAALIDLTLGKEAR